MKLQHCSEVSLEFNRHIINLLDSLSALSELAALSIHDFDEAQLLKHALEALMANQDMERCSIFLLDDAGRMVNAAGLDWHAMLADINRDGRIDAPPHRKGTQYRLGEGIMGRAAETAQIQHCRSCADDPEFSPYGQELPIHGSLICVPITCESRVLGVLNVFYPEAGFFNVWHERLLLLFCQVLGRLLLNHRFTFHLSTLLDEKTRETQATNTALQVEVRQRKAAMEQLDEQRLFLQNVIDSIPDPVMVIGDDYRVLMANSIARKGGNAAGDDAGCLTCHSISHGSDLPCADASHPCPLRRVQETGDTLSLMHVHRGANGESRQIELRAAPLYDRNGQFIGIVECARDITERTQMEAALRAAKDYAENLIRTANALIVELDAAGNVKVFNPAAEAATGYTVADLAGRNWFEVLVPKDRYPSVWGEFERLMAGGMPKQFESPIRTRTGEERYIAWQNSTLQQDGQVTGIVSFGMDITERKRADRRLREIERRMRALLDANSESSFLLDPAGNILAINAVAAGRFGKSPVDMLHRNFFDYLPAALARRRRAVFEQAIAGRQPLHNRDKRGFLRFETYLSPVLNDAGEVESVAIHARDVTEQQRNLAIDAMFHRLDLMLLKWRMDTKTIVQMFCDEIVSLFELAAAWIGQAESDGSLSFVGAAEAVDVHLLETLRRQCRRWDGGELECRPAGQAIREGLMQRVRADDSRCTACRNSAPGTFPASLLMLPLVVSGSNWGVLALYARNPRLLEQADIAPRLTSIASRLSVSIEASMQQEWLALLDTAVVSAGNAVFITDADARIKWANPAFVRLSGYSLEEIAGKDPSLFKSGEHDADFYRRFWQTLQSGQAWHGELVNLRRDGTRYVVNQTVTPLKDGNGVIGHYVSVLEDITDRKAKEAKIEYLANFDALTGLPNRSLLFDRLGQVIALSRRERTVGALLFLDLDGFKGINDRFGHEAGDLLLKSAAVRLRQQVRESDTVARLAGDEFVVVLPSIGAVADAQQVAEKIIAAIARPFDLDGMEATVGLSIGIATFPPDGDTAEAIINAADHAMYQAKHAGRGMVRVYRRDTHPT